MFSLGPGRSGGTFLDGCRTGGRPVHPGRSGSKNVMSLDIRDIPVSRVP